MTRCAVLLAFLTGCQAAQPPGVAVARVDERHYVVTRTVVPAQRAKADLLAHKPPHLPAHAHLWESNQDHFMLYGWVAYDGPVDGASNVHHLRVFDADGALMSPGHYVVVPAQTPLVVDFADYRVEYPLGKIVGLVTGGVQRKLLHFNYNDREYAPMFRPTRNAGPRPQLVTGYTVATGSPEADVYVALVPGPAGAQVTVEDEFHDMHTAAYTWQPLTAHAGVPPTPPFRFKYYDPTARALYLVDPHWALVEQRPGQKNKPQ
ncbi:hypothetical protein [Hymenobacter sp. APR13]|uniref:hypothetical protein n=1 Tax=Hymenobacter sp. APR13 TaxID=1356852 RepID=UPI0012E09764|nr:hypothetical protein [Hymenobacter sp. APR13]